MTPHSIHAARCLPGGALLVLLGALIGCGGPGGRADLAAEAGGEQLTPDRLATWVARVPSGQPVARDAGFVSLSWVDYTLLATALSEGRTLTDSATISAALLPDLQRLTLRHWHDTLAARRQGITEPPVEWLYEAKDLRVFQQIVVRVQDQRDVRAVAAARAQADTLLRRARAGADFAELARARSQDPTARDDGFLPVSRRGSLPSEFERSAWRIPPGGIGGVSSRIGFHILRRPPLAEVRDRLRRYGQALATGKADSLHLDSLTTARRLTVTRKAVAVLRAFFRDPGTRASATQPLVTWEGGSLGLDLVAPRIDLLPPRAYLDLRGGSDLTLQAFVKELGQQYLLLHEADAAGIRVPATERAALDSGYGRSLRESLQLLGVTDRASLPKADARVRVATLLDGLTGNRVKWRPLPGALGAVLRERSGYRLHQAGIDQAVRLAREARPKRDSANTTR